MKHLPLQMGPLNPREHRHWNDPVPSGTAHVPPFWQGFSGHLPYVSVLEWDLTDNYIHVVCVLNAVIKGFKHAWLWIVAITLTISEMGPRYNWAVNEPWHMHYMNSERTTYQKRSPKSQLCNSHCVLVYTDTCLAPPHMFLHSSKSSPHMIYMLSQLMGIKVCFVSTYTWIL